MATRSVLWFRRLLLVALVAFTALVLVTLFTREKPEGRVEGDPNRDLDTEGRGLVLAGEGFDYAYTEGGRTVLGIHGDRMLSDRDNNVILEGVGLTLYREDGDTFHLTSAEGTYNLETEQTELRGDVVVEGPDGLRLATDRLTVHRGQLIQSKAPVRFRFAERYVGRANSLTVTLRRRVYRLDGRVRVDLVRGEPAVGFLSCDLLLFERDEGQIRALGDVRLRRGEDFLSARRLAVRLTPDERRASFLLAHWGVTGRRSTVDAAGDPSWLSLQGETLSLALDETTGDPHHLEVESSGRSSVILEQEGADGALRRISTPHLTGEFVAGGLRHLSVAGPVALSEGLAFDRRALLGWGCARTGEIALVDGSMSSTILEGGVELWQGGLHSRGDRATIDQLGGGAEIRGAPAAMLSDRGEITAPRIQRDESGSVTAQGGVLARFADGAGSFRGRDEPVRIESETAAWTPAAGVVTFSGRVQAWQGTSLLLAEEVREDMEAERLTAGGGVRTLWERDQETVPDRLSESIPSNGRGAKTPSGGGPSALPGGAAPADPTLEPAESEPLEVTAESLVYDRQASLISYEGDVYVRQGLRSMRCQRMEAELDEEGEARTVTCREDATVVDRAAGRTVEGDLAVYDLATETARVSGERVRMVDQEGREIVGPVLIYDFATGTARVESPGVFEPRSEGEQP